MLRDLLNIMHREVNLMTSTSIYLFCMVGIPLISTFFFLTLMPAGIPLDLPVAVVDQENSVTTRNLARTLDSFEQTSVYMTTPDFDKARKLMQQGKIYGIFCIPKNFSREVARGNRPKIVCYSSYTFLVAGSFPFADMKTTALMAGLSVKKQKALAQGKTEEQLNASLQPIKIETHALGNPWQNYSIYLNNTLLPGVLQLIIFSMTVYSIGCEIKYGRAKEWLRMGKDNILLCLLGKLLPHTVVYVLVSLAMSASMFSFASFPLACGWFPLLLAQFLLILAAQGMGVFMFSILPTLRLGLSLSCLFGMLSFSIVGFSFPVKSMNGALQGLTKVFPLRHYFLLYVDQPLNGRPMLDSWVQYVWLFGFILLPFVMMPYLKRELKTFDYIP